MKTDILSMDKNELAEYLEKFGEPKYKAAQIFSWLHKGSGFNGMTNISKETRAALFEDAYIARAKIEKKQVSKDGTVKYLFSFEDGEAVESVVMKYEHGRSICISTEAGCNMKCAFCASTQNGCTRRLTPSEMLAQIIAAKLDLKDNIGHIVLMGMGEPLDNYDNVIKFIRLANAEGGLNIGFRNISLSTCGLADKILRLKDEKMPITLSISLHAPNNEIRDKIMPVNKKWDIKELMSAVGEYYSATKRRIYFEYILIKDLNDGKHNAQELARLLKSAFKNVQYHVNLIPLNPVDKIKLQAPSIFGVTAFEEELKKNNIQVTVRRKLGNDIDASCGQLKNRYRK